MKRHFLSFRPPLEAQGASAERRDVRHLHGGFFFIYNAWPGEGKNTLGSRVIRPEAMGSSFPLSLRQPIAKDHARSGVRGQRLLIIHLSDKRQSFQMGYKGGPLLFIAGTEMEIGSPAQGLHLHMEPLKLFPKGHGGIHILLAVIADQHQTGILFVAAIPDGADNAAHPLIQPVQSLQSFL